jgi:hypothetical protein
MIILQIHIHKLFFLLFKNVDYFNLQDNLIFHNLIKLYLCQIQYIFLFYYLYHKNYKNIQDKQI